MPVTIPTGQPTVVNPSGRTSTLRPAAPTGAQALSIDQVGIQQLLGMLNNPGTYVPGSGGSYTNNAGARAAEVAAGNAGQAGLDNAYGQAVTNTQARNPLIQQAADNADATMAADTNARLASIQAASDQRAAAQQAAAHAMGLAWTPQVSGASQQGDLLSKQASINTSAWKGLNDANAAANIDRNSHLASSFTYALGQSKAKLAQQVAKTLSTLGDRHSAGSAGKYVGGTTVANNIAIAKALIGQGNTQQKQGVAAGKAQSGSVSTTTSTTPTGTKQTQTVKR